MSFAREIVFISNAKMYSYVDYTVFIPIVSCCMSYANSQNVSCRFALSVFREYLYTATSRFYVDGTSAHTLVSN